MFCPNCGKEVSDQAKFCGGCGTAITNQAPAQTQASVSPAQTQPVNQQVNTAPIQQKKQGKFAKWLRKSKKNKVIFFGGIALIVIGSIVTYIILNYSSEQDKMKNLINDSSLVHDGVISQRYSDYSEYSMKEFNITNQNDTPNGNNTTSRYCEFEATIENNSFKSDVKASCTFNIDGQGNFVLNGNPNVIEKNTIPLKGVSQIEYKAPSKYSSSSYSSNSYYNSYSQSKTSNNDYELNIIEFNSDLAESGDSYTSTATENVEFKFWFATDKGTLTQTYKFSSNDGWKTEGDQQIANKSTVWTLAGKSFSYHYTPSSSYSQSYNFSLNFKDSGQATTVAADYTVYREANKSSSSSSTTKYYEINRTGSFSGTPVHDFGSGTFSVTLSDGTVTAKISDPNKKTKDNTDEVKHTLRVNLDTELAYETWGSSSYKFKESFTVDEN